MKVKDITLDTMLREMLALCKDFLNLSDLPKISLLQQATVGGETSFGVYDGGIQVATKDRHPMDIMRTLAHELVHWSQDQNGQTMDGSDGSPTEDEANALAGQIMRKFGKMHPEYFDY